MVTDNVTVVRYESDKLEATDEITAGVQERFKRISINDSNLAGAKPFRTLASEKI